MAIFQNGDVLSAGSLRTFNTDFAGGQTAIDVWKNGTGSGTGGGTGTQVGSFAITPKEEVNMFKGALFFGSFARDTDRVIYWLRTVDGVANGYGVNIKAQPPNAPPSTSENTVGVSINSAAVGSLFVPMSSLHLKSGTTINMELLASNVNAGGLYGFEGSCLPMGVGYY